MAYIAESNHLAQVITSKSFVSPEAGEKFCFDLLDAIRNQFRHIDVNIVGKKDDSQYGFFVRIGMIRKRIQTSDGLRWEYHKVLDYHIQKIEQNNGVWIVTLKRW
ncbi:MAG: hypothetical protein ACKO0Z_20895 [Betaproteobacteria bacterium]